MFVDINSEQVRVSKNLIIELYSDLYWNSPDPDERLLALSSRIGSNLSTRLLSPIKGRVMTTGSKKSYFTCLSLTNISDGLIENKLIGEVHGNQLSPGPLSVSNPEDLEGTLKKVTQIVGDYFGLFASEVPENWVLGDATDGYLCTNNAIRTLFLVLRYMCQHLERVTQVQCYNLNAADLLSNLKPLCDPLLTFFRNATSSDFKSFRNQQGGLKGITKQAMMMMQYIHKSKPEFNPPGLKEHIDSQDHEGTKDDRDLINNIERVFFEKGLNRLKQNSEGKESKWWAQGVRESFSLGEWVEIKRGVQPAKVIYIS